MKLISQKIATGLQKHDKIPPEELQLYAFGIQTIFEIGLSFLCGVLIAILYDMIFEFFIFMLLFIPLRSYVGGFHFKKFLPCLLCSAAVQCVALIIIRENQLQTKTSCFLIGISLIAVRSIGIVESRKKHDGISEIYFKRKMEHILWIILVVTILLVFVSSSYYLSIIAVTMIVMIVSMIVGLLKIRMTNKNVE